MYKRQFYKLSNRIELLFQESVCSSPYIKLLPVPVRRRYREAKSLTSLAEVTPLRSLKSYRNRIAVEWRRIEVAPAGITEHYSLKKQLFWFGLEPPTRRSRSKSAPKFYPNRLRFGSTRAKNLFGVKTSLWSSITRKFNPEFASIYQHIKLC